MLFSHPTVLFTPLLLLLRIPCLTSWGFFSFIFVFVSSPFYSVCFIFPSSELVALHSLSSESIEESFENNGKRRQNCMAMDQALLFHLFLFLSSLRTSNDVDDVLTTHPGDAVEASFDNR